MDTQKDNFDISSGHKKLRFDEENIRNTLHPTRREYGFMEVAEAQTPYPRHSNPIQAEALRKHLEKCVARANQILRDENRYDKDDQTSFSYNIDDMKTPANSWASIDEELKLSEFERKRKQFNIAEFIIAQQKIMGLEMPKPGPSIGDNWRVIDKKANCTSYRVPTRMSSLIGYNRSRASSINYETLHEVFKHAYECKMQQKEENNQMN